MYTEHLDFDNATLSVYLTCFVYNSYRLLTTMMAACVEYPTDGR